MCGACVWMRVCVRKHEEWKTQLVRACVYVFVCGANVVYRDWARLPECTNSTAMEQGPRRCGGGSAPHAHMPARMGPQNPPSPWSIAARLRCPPPSDNPIRTPARHPHHAPTHRHHTPHTPPSFKRPHLVKLAATQPQVVTSMPSRRGAPSCKEGEVREVTYD